MAELPDLVDGVLQKQHAQLLERLDAWLGRVEEAMDKGRMGVLLPPLGPPPEMPEAPETINEEKLLDDVAESGSLTEGTEGQRTPKPDGPTHSVSARSIRKTIQANHDYELAQEEAIRFQSVHQVSKEMEAPRGSWCRCCQDWALMISTSVAFNVIVAAVIVSNSVFLGIELEWVAVGVLAPSVILFWMSVFSTKTSGACERRPKASRQYPLP